MALHIQPRRQDRLFAWALAGAIALFVLGWGLLNLTRANADLPPLRQFMADAGSVYLPAARGEGSANWLSDSMPLNRAWKLLWLEAGGQWDARVLGLAGSFLQAAALGMLALQFIGASSRATAFAFAIALVGMVTLAPLVPRGDAAAPSLCVVLSMLQLRAGWNAASSRRHGAAGVLGALNLAISNFGVAASAALLVAALRRPRAADDSGRGLRIIVPATLVVLGLGLLALRRPAEMTSWTAFAAWPRVSPIFVPLLWGPALLIGFSSRFRFEGDASLHLLAPWAIGTVALASCCSPGPAEVVELLVAAVAVNLACAFAVCRWAWRAREAGKITSSAIFHGPALFAGLWCVLVFDALLHPPAGRASPAAPPDVNGVATAALRTAVLDDPRLLGTTDLGPTGIEVEKLAALLADDDLRRVLPASVRPPLSMRASPEATRGFAADAVPDLSARDGLPAVGTWTSEGGSATGEYASLPLRTDFALLQFRVAGELRNPGTSLALRAKDGNETGPFENNFSSEARWKRVNFPAPAGEFQVIARDSSASAWISITAPHEVSRIGWMAGKIVREWVWLFVAASLGAVVAIGRAWRTMDVRAADAWYAGFPWPVVPIVAVVAYTAVWSNHLDPTAGPNDAGGYLNLARNFSAGEVMTTPRLLREDPLAKDDVAPYVPTTFWPTTDGRMVPEYPPGVPLIFAAGALFVPLAQAVPMLIILQLALGLYFTRRLALAFGLPEGWAWLAAFLLGMNAVYIWQGMQPQSDVPATVWVTAAVGWAWTSRSRPWHALLAGVATAVAVLIRPSNVLVALPIAVCLFGHWRQLALWVLGGIPGAVWLAWYNRELYGAFLATGYGDMSVNFGTQFILPTIRSYVKWLPLYFSPLVVLGLGGLFVRSESARARAVLGSWVGAFVVFYACYWCTWDNWYNMRFVMPAAPAMIVLGLFCLRAIATRFAVPLFAAGSFRHGFVGSTAVAVLLFGVLLGATLKENVMYWMRSNKRHQVVSTWVNEHLPANSIVYARIGSNVLYYYTRFVVVRSDNARARSAEFAEMLRQTGRPVYAVTYRVEGRDRIAPGVDPATAHAPPDVPGNWTRIADLYEGDIAVWQRQ